MLQSRIVYSLNPLSAHSGQKNLAGKGIAKKIFDGEMFIRTLPTTLIQRFKKIIVYSKVIFKSIIDPDDNCWKDS